MMMNKTQAANAAIAGLHAPTMDIHGLVAATNLLQGSLEHYGQLEKANNKEKQMFEANKYASDLLGKGDLDSIKKATPMLAYASPEMQQQARDLRTQLTDERNFGFQKDQADVHNEQFNKRMEFDLKQLNAQVEQWGKQNNLSEKQIQAHKEAAALQYKAQMAGITEQAKTRMANTQMQQQWHNDQIALQKIGMDQTKIANATKSLNDGLDAAFAQGTGLFNWASIDADKVVQMKNLAGNYAMQLMTREKNPMSPQAAVNQAMMMVTKQMPPSYTSSSLLDRVTNVLK
jgi:hypothetical protein